MKCVDKKVHGGKMWDRIHMYPITVKIVNNESRILGGIRGEQTRTEKTWQALLVDHLE